MKNTIKDKEAREMIRRMLKKRKCERCHRFLFVDSESENCLLEEDFSPHLYPCLM